MTILFTTLSIRLRMLGVPGSTSERLFISEITFCDDSLDVQDIFRLIDTKLKFLDVPSDTPYTVMHANDTTGDRVVVDDGYLPILLSQLFPSTEREGEKGLPNDHPFDDHHVSVSQIPQAASPTSRTPEKRRRAGLTLIVELASRERDTVVSSPLTTSTSAANARKRTIVPLTFEALNALSGDLAPPADASTSPPHTPSPPPLVSSSTPPVRTLLIPAATQLTQQHIEAQSCNSLFLPSPLVVVILSMRSKRASSILELELCDPTLGPSGALSRITALSFDADQVRSLSMQLRANGTEVAELRNVVMVKKTDRDQQYEANAHPFQLRFTARTTVQVQSLLGTPMMAERHRTVLQDAQTTSIVRTVGMIGSAGTGAAAVTRPSLGKSLMTIDALPRATAGGAVGSLQGAPAPPMAAAQPNVKTSFNVASLSNTRLATPNGSISSGSSSRGSHSGLSASHNSRHSSSGGVSAPTVLPYVEPGVRAVSARDVSDRDLQLERSEQAVEARKNKIRQRLPLSTKCLICDFDGESPQASLDALHDVLRRHSRRKAAGAHAPLPTFEEVMNAVADKRSLYRVLSPTAQHLGRATATRYYCETRVVDLLGKMNHVIHPRCAHLCTSYQRGQVALEDLSFHKSMVLCRLCGLAGATVACYHPECDEQYHTLCAIFSLGYVNFGNRDPLRPCPSCPKHAQVINLLDKRHDQHAKRSRTTSSSLEDEEDVLFDSGVVEKEDLRDLDEDINT